MKNWHFILRPLLVVSLVAGGILVYITVFLTDANVKGKRQDYRNGQKSGMTNRMNIWALTDFRNPDLPKSVEDFAKDAKFIEKRITVMNVDTFYREATPPHGVTPSGLDVLLLHGANFKSKTWTDLGTVQLLAAMGHHVIAIDLPGFGETTTQFSGDPAEYLKNLISATELSKPVIVSPSMSGGYSIPFIIQHKEALSGFVPVAPVNTDDIGTSAASLYIPTLIIYGEKDRSLGRSSEEDLKKIPTSNSFILPDAGHPAYLDQPLMFHTLLYNFLNAITAQKS